MKIVNTIVIIFGLISTAKSSLMSNPCTETNEVVDNSNFAKILNLKNRIADCTSKIFAIEHIQSTYDSDSINDKIKNDVKIVKEMIEFSKAYLISKIEILNGKLSNFESLDFTEEKPVQRQENEEDIAKSLYYIPQLEITVQNCEKEISQNETSQDYLKDLIGKSADRNFNKSAKVVIKDLTSRSKSSRFYLENYEKLISTLNESRSDIH